MNAIKEREVQERLSEHLHSALGQHLIGSLLAAEALTHALSMREAPELSQAQLLVTFLKEANQDVVSLIKDLDCGLPR